MYKQIYGIIILVTLFSCYQKSSSKQEVNYAEIKQIKRIKILYYQVNVNKDSIGYKKFKDGEISSIRSIKIVDKAAFLIDQVHNNIKKIDLTNGKLSSSEKLDTDGSSLYNIAYFNDLIYVFTYRGRVYLLDEDLKRKGSFFLPNYIGDVDIYSANDDSLIIYRNSDIMQDKKLNDYLRRMIIDNKNNYSFDTISVNNEEFITRLRKETGKEVEFGDKLIYKTSQGEYEIPENIEVKKNYDCKRIDFTDNYLVTFEVNPIYLKLVVYEY